MAYIVKWTHYGKYVSIECQESYTCLSKALFKVLKLWLNPFTWFVKIKRDTNHSRIASRLNDFSNIKEGWDGFCGEKPLDKTLKNATRIVLSIDENILDNSTVFPSNDGGIYIEGRLKGNSFVIYVYETFMTYVFHNYGSLSDSVNINKESIKSLNDKINFIVS